MAFEGDAFDRSPFQDVLDALSRRGFGISTVSSSGRGLVPVLPASSHRVEDNGPPISSSTAIAANGISANVAASVAANVAASVAGSVAHTCDTLLPASPTLSSLPRHLRNRRPSTMLTLESEPEPSTFSLPASSPAFAARSRATASRQGADAADLATGSRADLDGAAGALPRPSFSRVGSEMEAQAMRGVVRRGVRMTAISEPKSGQDGRFKKATVHNGGGSVSLDKPEVVRRRRATATEADPSPSHNIAFTSHNCEYAPLQDSTIDSKTRRVAPRTQALPPPGSSSSSLGASKFEQPQGKKVCRRKASLTGFVVNDEAPIVWDSDADEVFMRDKEEDEEEEDFSDEGSSSGSYWSDATSQSEPPFWGSKYGSAIWPAPSRRERPLSERFWMYDHSRMKGTCDSG